MITQNCPICDSSLTFQDDVALCSICGSLEGFSVEDLVAQKPKPNPKCLFGYDWASGGVAPWKTSDGKIAYSTPDSHALLALNKAGLPKDGTGLVIDMGCGDASILVNAAVHFKARGIGLEIDPVAIEEAKSNILKHNVQDLVSIECRNFMKMDILQWVKTHSKIEYSSIVLVAFLLPDALRDLKPTFQSLFLNVEHFTLITFKWDVTFYDSELDHVNIISRKVRQGDTSFTIYTSVLDK